MLTSEEPDMNVAQRTARTIWEGSLAVGEAGQSGRAALSPGPT
jgi:hypothetical protein